MRLQTQVRLHVLLPCVRARCTLRRARPHVWLSACGALNTFPLLSLSGLPSAATRVLFLAQNAHVYANLITGHLYVNLHNMLVMCMRVCIKHTHARGIERERRLSRVCKWSSSNVCPKLVKIYANFVTFTFAIFLLSFLMTIYCFPI